MRPIAEVSLTLKVTKAGSNSPSFGYNSVKPQYKETTGDMTEVTADQSGIRIGTLVRNSDLADQPPIKTNYPLISQALLSGASPQLRNMATTGGNLLQRMQ